MVVWPRRRGDDPTAAVERLAGRRGALLRANAAALVACGVLLALAPAAGGAVVVQTARPRPVGGRRHHRLRVAEDGDVAIRPVGGGADLVVIADAREPSLSGNHVAFVDGGGVTVCDWQADTPVDEHPRRLAPGPRLAAARLRQGRFQLQA